MTSWQLEELKKIVNQATSGEWDLGTNLHGDGPEDTVRSKNGDNIAIVPKEENAIFISTFNPEMVQELLTEIEELWKQRYHLASVLAHKNDVKEIEWWIQRAMDAVKEWP